MKNLAMSLVIAVLALGLFFCSSRVVDARLGYVLNDRIPIFDHMSLKNKPLDVQVKAIVNWAEEAMKDYGANGRELSYSFGNWAFGDDFDERNKFAERNKFIKNVLKESAKKDGENFVVLTHLYDELIKTAINHEKDCDYPVSRHIKSNIYSISIENSLLARYTDSLYKCDFVRAKKFCEGIDKAIEEIINIGVIEWLIQEFKIEKAEKVAQFLDVSDVGLKNIAYIVAVRDLAEGNIQKPSEAVLRIANHFNFHFDDLKIKAYFLFIQKASLDEIKDSLDVIPMESFLISARRYVKDYFVELCDLRLFIKKVKIAKINPNDSRLDIFYVNVLDELAYQIIQDDFSDSDKVEAIGVLSNFASREKLVSLIPRINDPEKRKVLKIILSV